LQSCIRGKQYLLGINGFKQVRLGRFQSGTINPRVHLKQRD